MVSNTQVVDEGWSHIDKLESNVCQPPVDEGIYYPDHIMPYVLHYCQFFRAGELGFQKRRLIKSLFSCEYPMLLDPPVDLGNVTYKNRDGEVMEPTCVCLLY